ncbi:MAG: STN domain-containing protein [Bacteroidetes bacterium]|nr:STN domain-containing protein [Bacteroidota bacterium]
MKFFAFFLLSFILPVCSPAISQRVSIHGKDLPLGEVFTTIRKQTGFEFLYQSSLLEGSHPVSLDVDSMRVDEVLKFALKGQGLGFNIRSGTVIIFKESDPAKKKSPPSTNPEVFVAQ